MKTNVSLFLFAIFSLMFVACENNSDEIVDNASALSRSVSSRYYLDGADELYTGQPQIYTLKKMESTSLDGVYVKEWNYSSDLYKVNSSDVSITLARKLALGNYIISASLSNGETISKQITAIDEPTPSVTKNIFIRPVGISKSLEGPYDDINDYRYATGQSYNLVSGDNLCLKCQIENTASSSIRIDVTNIMFAYGNSSVQYAPKSIFYENLNPVSGSVNISRNSSVTVIFYLGCEWLSLIHI